jgi:hypothetical protein
MLDKGVLDSFTNDNFWSNSSNVTGYANTFYNQFTGYGNGNGFGLFYFKTLSDDQAGNSFADWDQKNNLTTNSTWRDCYVEIRRANIMIANVPKIDETDAVKAHWTGVARLMRAYEYYLLVRMFGDVPYSDEQLDINSEVLYGPRTNRDQVMDKVLEDLNFAVANIDDVSGKMVWSRNMAQAMKADICLYEGTFRKYRKAEDGQPAPDQAGATKFLTECKNACSALMSKGFSLSPSYQANYNSVDLTSNPEVIFFKAYKQALLTHSLIDYTCTSTQMSGMTKDAFDAYLFIDGKPLALTAEDNNLVPPLVNGKLNLNDMLAVRDKRLAVTIDTVMLYTDNTNQRFPGDMFQESSTGYGVAKYDNGDIPLAFRNQSSSNYTDAPIYWLSVVYLNYAEACAELGGITQADLDNSINKLRARAGLPALNVNVGFSDPANTAGVSDLIWEIRRERRCELMFDNWFRYWDLVRWHQLDKLDSTKYPNVLIGGNIKNDPKFESAKVGDFIDASKGHAARDFDNKYYLYPIPSGQIDLNPALLPNNPGW